MAIPLPNPVPDTNDTGSASYDAIADLLSGSEFGMDTFAGTNRDDSVSLDCCSPCECNCDIFTDFFSARTPNVTVDKVGNPLWELLSGTMPALATRSSRSCLVFTNPATLICKASALRYNNFSAGIDIRFSDKTTAGQQVEWIFDYQDDANYSYWLIETVTIPGNFNLPPIQPFNIQISLWQSGDSSPKFKKYLSVPSSDASAFGGLLSVGSYVMQVKPGYGFIWSQDSAGSPAGLTFDNFGSLSTGKMGIKVRSTTAEIQLFMFRIHENYDATVRPKCQDHVWGMETGPTDNYPANKYSVNIVILPGGIGSGETSKTISVTLDDMTDQFNSFLPLTAGGGLSPHVQHFTYKKTIPRPAGTTYGDANWDVYFTTYYNWQTAFGLPNGPAIVVDTRSHNPGALQFHTCGRSWDHVYSSSLGNSRAWSTMYIDPAHSGDPDGYGSLATGIDTASVTAIHP